MQKRSKTVAVAVLGAGLAFTTLSGCNGTSSQQGTTTHHSSSTTHARKSNHSNITPPSVQRSNGAPTGSITTR